MAYTDPSDVANSVQAQHDLAAEVINAYCRRSFGQKTEVTVDGSGSDTLNIPLPALSLSEVIQDGESIPVGRILVSGFRLIRTDGDWKEGKLNVVIRGVLGYNPPPALVIEASKRLVAKMVDGSWSPGNFGQIKVGSISYDSGRPEDANIIGDTMIEALLDPLVRKIRTFSV